MQIYSLFNLEDVENLCEPKYALKVIRVCIWLLYYCLQLSDICTAKTSLSRMRSKSI